MHCLPRITAFSACVAVVAAPSSRAQQPPEKPPEPLQVPVQATTAPKGLLFHIGESTLKLGGYVKVDLLHDFDEIGSTNSFDPRTIPTDDSTGVNTEMTARESRLNLDLRTPTSLGEMKTYIEGDFAGSSNAFRMRHAYGQVGRILGGQTWSTFMDEAAMPSTLDFESPIAFPLVRQAQIRYTQPFENGNYAAVSLEDPDNDVLGPIGVPGESENPAPDLNARLHLENARGHVQLGAFAGMAQFQPDVGSADDVFLWGLNLSAKETTWGNDFAIVQLTYGDGVGRYRGGTTAVPDSSGDLEAVRTTGILASYQHEWSEEYRSTLAYSIGEGDLPNGAPPDANEELTYLAANLIWQFCDRAWVGIEYLHGSRETFDGADGEANRLQLALRFDL